MESRFGEVQGIDCVISQVVLCEHFLVVEKWILEESSTSYAWIHLNVD